MSDGSFKLELLPLSVPFRVVPSVLKMSTKPLPAPRLELSRYDVSLTASITSAVGVRKTALKNWPVGTTAVPGDAVPESMGNHATDPPLPPLAMKNESAMAGGGTAGGK